MKTVLIAFSQQNLDVIVGYTVQELFEDRAQKFPDQCFVLIDTTSEVEILMALYLKNLKAVI